MLDCLALESMREQAELDAFWAGVEAEIEQAIGPAPKLEDE